MPLNRVLTRRCLRPYTLTPTPTPTGGNVVFDAEFNCGTKALNNTGIKRMNALAEWVMQRPEDTVVCVGHSLYFRSFFRVRRGGEKKERERAQRVCVCVL